MAKKYQMVRLSAETKLSLDTVRAAMQLSNIEGTSQHAENEIYGVTLDVAIAKLIEDWWSKRLRSGSRPPQTVREVLETFRTGQGGMADLPLR